MRNRMNRRSVALCFGLAVLLGANSGVLAQEATVKSPEGTGGWVRVLTYDAAAGTFAGIENVRGQWKADAPVTYRISENCLFSMARPVALENLVVGEWITVNYKGTLENPEPTRILVQRQFEDQQATVNANMVVGKIRGVNNNRIGVEALDKKIIVTVPPELSIIKSMPVDPGAVLRRNQQVWVTRTGSPPIATSVEKQ